jgi:glutathione S-transferase
LKLVIGNKNYSSWSLRPWLLLSAHGIPFEEVRIPLYRDDTGAQIQKYSAAGKVPVLHDAGVVVWDSLAICEYVSERHLDGKGWPADWKARAEARSCSAEMHSGFFALRAQMPMNCRATGRKVARTPELQKDIARIDALWSGLRAKYAAGGDWLFGEFSIADCLFAPVAFRFNTYQVDVSDASRAYMNTVLAHPKVRAWAEQARNETSTLEAFEAGV